MISYLLKLCFLSTVFSKNIDSNTKDSNKSGTESTESYNYNNDYDDDYDDDVYKSYDYDNKIPLKPTQLDKIDINLKSSNSRKSNSFPTIPTTTTQAVNSFIEKTCFVGESITLQATSVEDWLIIKWQKDNNYFKPTVGAFQSSIGMVTLFQDFNKNMYDIPQKNPSALVIKKCGFDHSGVYQMVYTTSNGDQHDVKEFLVKVYQKPTGILVEKDGDWKKLGYVKENEDKKNSDFNNLAHCVSTSLPKSSHIWMDQTGAVYSPQNIQEETDEITKSVTVISYLQLKPDRSLAGKIFTCKINYSESSEDYQETIIDALEVQYKPDVPVITLDTEISGKSSKSDTDSETQRNIVCLAEANPDAKLQFYLIEPDGTEEVFGGLEEEAKISTLHPIIKNLQKLDENVKPDIHGESSFSKIKCVAKNSRGQAEALAQLKDILNPKKGGIFGETYNKALVWICSQVPVIRYGIIGGFGLFLALIFLLSIFICKRSSANRNRPVNFNHREGENKPMTEYADYTVDRGEFVLGEYKQDFPTKHFADRAGSTASSRPPKESIKRRILAHKNAKDFDSDDEGDAILSPNDRVLSPGGFSDPMSQGMDHMDLQPPPPGPQPVGMNQYGIQGSNI